jgi:PAS domain S-box-containing protein
VPKKPTIKQSGKTARKSQNKAVVNLSSENARQDPEKWSLMAIESAPYGVMVHDRDGKILIFNHQLEAICGYRKDEIPDITTWIKKVYPDDDYRRLVLEERKNKIQKDRRRIRKTIITRKDGEKCICEFSSILSSASIRTVFIKDTNELRRTEDSLRESEERFRLLTEAAFEGILIHKDGVLLHANDQFFEMFGYQAQEILGRQAIPILIAPESVPYIKKQIREGTSTPYDVIGRKKDGTTFPILIHAKTMEYQDNEVRVAVIRDLSYHKQAESELRKSEAQLSAVIESLPFDFFILDKNGRYVMQNCVCRHRWGDIIGKRLQDVAVDEETLALWQENNRRAFAGETVRGEIELSPGGQKEYYHNIVSPIQDQGKILGIMGVNIDITSLKNAEQALRQSEVRFREMAENIHEVFWLFDWVNQKVEYVSPAYEEVWGRRAQDLYDNYDEWGASIYPDDKTYAEASFARIVQTGGGETREYRIVRPDGTARWVSDRGFAITDKNGDVIRIAGIAEDITERRQALEALGESEEKFRTVTEQSPNMIFINRKGKVVYANRQCEQIMGYLRAEFYAPDFDFMTIVAPESRKLIQSNFEKHIQGKEIAPYEYTLINKTGKRIDVIITTKLIHYEGERSILGIVTDISERKLAEKRLRAKDKKMQQQAKNLEEVNTALKVLLEQREKEKTELKENLLMNIKKLIFPYIEKLENRRLDEDTQTFVNIIKSNLNDLISPLASTLSSKYFQLTPSELQIVDLIKQGKTSKDIASMLNVSPKAVSFHRGNLRKKLGLLNKKINLRTYLQSFPK